VKAKNQQQYCTQAKDATIGPHAKCGHIFETSYQMNVGMH
jgi:hypothetical protein